MVHLRPTTNALNSTARSNKLPPATQPASNQAFGQQLLDAGQQAMRNLFGGSSTAASATPVASTNSVPNAASAVLASLPGGSSASDPVYNGTTTIVTTPSPAPIAMLQAAMTAEGMSTAGIKMDYKEQTVQYPGGSYQSRMIQCDMGNGRVTYIDADVMKVNPQIAALDLKWIQAHPKIGA